MVYYYLYLIQLVAFNLCPTGVGLGDFDIEGNEFELKLDLECELELECKNINCGFYDCGDLCYGYYPTPAPTYPQIPTVFDLFWIIFGIIFYVFVNEILNENENVEIEFEFELECEFVNVFGNDKCDNICNGYYPTPSPTFYFNNNDNGLPGINVVECIFGVNDNENGFEYGMYIFFFGKK